MARRAADGGEGGQVLIGLVGGLVALVVGVFVLGAVANGVRGAGLGATGGRLGRAGRRAGDARGLPAVVRAGRCGRRGRIRGIWRGGVRRIGTVHGRARGGAPTAGSGGRSPSPTGRASRPCGSACRCAGASRWPGAGSRCEHWRRPSWAAEAGGGFAHGGGYDGRCGAAGQADAPGRGAAFDRMAAAASADGVQLLISQRFRSDAEQARLFARASRPEVGRAAGHVAAPLRHRARPRAGVRLRVAAPTRRGSTSSSATTGSLALRLTS
jgi:hypothetical protein